MKFFKRSIRSVLVPKYKLNAGTVLCKKDLKSHRTVRCLELKKQKRVCKNEENDGSVGILDQSKILFKRNALWQAYDVIEKNGEEGTSMCNFMKSSGFTKLDSRCLIRKLLKEKDICSIKKSVGRQLMNVYVASKFASAGVIKEYDDEIKKMKKFVKLSSDENLCFMNTSTDLAKSEKLPVVTQSQGASNSSLMTHGSTSVSNSTIAKEEVSLSKNEDGVSVVSSTPIVTDDPSTCTVVETVVNSSISCRKAGEQSRLLEIDSSALLTTRHVKRVTLILEMLKEQKIVDGLHTLLKWVWERELKDGSNYLLDRKSLRRLLDKLACQGFLKIILVELKVGDKLKKCEFLVNSDISEDSQIFQSAIERKKCSLQILQKETATSTLQPRESIDFPSNIPVVHNSDFEKFLTCNVSEMKLLRSASTSAVQNSSQSHIVHVGRFLCSRFNRLMAFHKLLFYLIYDYQGDENLNQETAWQAVLQTMENEKFDYPRLYCKEVSYKMFLSPIEMPLNFHKGWFFMPEIIVRIPLSIFVNVLPFPDNASAIKEYLSHPIKMNIPIKYLPPEIKAILFYKNKPMSYLRDICKKLCYIGLGQFGPRLMKEVEYFFFYLNRKACLIDTTISNPGYLHISPDKDYVRKEYTLENSEDVMDYWKDMWTICLHTPLGGFLSDSGKLVTIHVLDKKSEMIEATQNRDFEEAPKRDVGYIPGDGRGASGFDSALFSHLRRNWLATPTFYADTSKNHSNESNKDLSCPVSSVSSHTTSSTSSKNVVPGISTVRLSLYKPKSRDQSIQSVPVRLVGRTKINKAKEIHASTSRILPKVRSIKVLRKVKQYKKKDIKRYDEKDLAALRRLPRFRCTWSSGEDSLLLLCKVAAAYLFSTKLSVINSFVIRDILHTQYSESRSKTSVACRRRITYLMKKKKNVLEDISVILGELQEDKDITNEFKPIDTNLKLSEIYKNYIGMYKKLVFRLISKYAVNKKVGTYDLPDTLEELMNNFEIFSSNRQLFELKFASPISSEAHISQHVITSLILSSLCTKQDRESWAYQLFLVYRKYPQSLLSSALQAIRKRKIIIYKDTVNQSQFARLCLPLTSSPFKMSYLFLYLFQIKFHYDIFSEVWNMLNTFLNLKIDGEFDKSKKLRDVSIVSSERPQKGLLETNKISTVLSAGGCCKRKHQLSSESRDDLEVFAKKPRISSPLSNSSSKQITTEFVLDNHEGVKIEPDVYSGEVSSEIITLPNLLSGGSTACLLSLFATNHIDLNAEIPNQVILIENSSVSDPLGESFSSLSNLLRKVDDKESRPLRNDSEFDMVKMDVDEDIYATENTDESSNVRDDMVYFSSDNAEDARLKALSNSKFKVYKMREKESGGVDLPFASIDDLSLNPCTVTCQLNLPASSELPPAFTPTPHSVNQLVTIVDFNRVRKALAARKKVIVSGVKSLDDALEKGKNEGRSEKFLSLLKRLHSFVDDKGIFGASSEEIKEQFISVDEDICPMRIMEFLVEFNVIWIVGRETLRFVTASHIKPWVVSTNKIPRKNGNEDDSKQAANLSSPNSKVDHNRVQNIRSGRALQVKRYRRDSNAIKDAEESAISLQAQANYKQIDVLVRPWVRMNGCLNRRVMDGMIRSILIFIMENPGCSGQSITKRFWPSLDPAHTYELLDTLVKLEAVTKYAVKKSHPIKLFSKPQIITMEKADELDYDQSLFYEAEVDCMVKYAAFISNKKYSVDLLMSSR